MWILWLTSSSISMASFPMLDPKYLKHATYGVVYVHQFLPLSHNLCLLFNLHFIVYFTPLGGNHLCWRFLFIFLTFNIFVLSTPHPKLYTYANSCKENSRIFHSFYLRTVVNIFMLLNMSNLNSFFFPGAFHNTFPSSTRSICSLSNCYSCIRLF